MYFYNTCKFTKYFTSMLLFVAHNKTMKLADHTHSSESEDLGKPNINPITA